MSLPVTSRENSTFVSSLVISCLVSCEPSRELIKSAVRRTGGYTLPRSITAFGKWLSSTSLLATFPLAWSRRSSVIFASTARVCRGLWPLVKRVTASVNRPCSILVRRIEYISKVAASRIMLVVLASTSVSPPPITPPIPSKDFSVAIIMASLRGSTSLPPRSIIFSPFLG